MSNARDDSLSNIDALLVLSYGGPEKTEDVLPFLRHVAGSRPIPEARLAEVAQHYFRFDGRSPLNDQNRALIASLANHLEADGPNLPIYFGNRNWHPFLTDTVRRMKSDGVRRALVYVTSAFSSYSGCRQYQEDLEAARTAVGIGAPVLEKLRIFYNHPGFLLATADRVREALERWPAEKRRDVRLVFTAHSIPLSMARACDYVVQLQDASSIVARLVREGDRSDNRRLAYQSRSGPASVPWLAPDILDHLDETAREGVHDVLVVPIGFLSDHMEVLYDLDTEARERADALGIRMERAGTVGTHPTFVAMIRELILERCAPGAQRRFLGSRGPEPDGCSPHCCGKGGDTQAWKSSSSA